MLLFKQIVAIFLLAMTVAMAKPTVDHCSTCRSISEFVQEMEHNQTQSIMKMNFFKMCLKENDGANSKVCVFLASTMQNTLKHIGNEDFCTKINACPSARLTVKPTVTNEERCEFCTDLVDSFKSLLDGNNEVLKQSLSQYCEMTGDFRDECQKTVDNNLVNFVDFVQNKMDSEALCHAIKSCHHQSLEEKSQPSIGDLISLRDPGQMANHFDLMDKQTWQNDVKRVDALGNPITCMVCRQVVVIIYSQLHKNATRENVAHLLSKACKTVHPKDKTKEQECETKLSKNIDLIIQSFINKVHPEIVCLISGMCVAGEEMKPIKEVARIQDIEIDNQYSLVSKARDALHWAQNYKCYFCEKIVDFLFKELDEKKTREYIKHLLDKSCDALFKKEERETKCEEYVETYTDKLIDLVEKASNPALICNALHMCKVNMTYVNQWDAKRLNSKVHVEKTPEPTMMMSRDGPIFKIDWCKVCQKTYPILTEIVQVDEFKDQIKNIAHRFCDSRTLPINVDQCKKKADEYVEVIVNVRDSKDGCEKLTLCPVNQETISFNFDLKVVDLGQSLEQPIGAYGWWEDIKCASCKLLVKSAYENMKQIINSKSTKDFIDRTCEHIHEDELRDKCKQDAMKALITLLKDFEENLPPKKACELMHYCDKKEAHDSSSLKPLFESSACNSCKTLFPVLHRVFQCQKVREVATDISDKVCERTCADPDKCKKAMSDLITNLADEETSEAGCSTLCKNDLVSVFSFGKVSECTACQTSMIAVDLVFKSEPVRHHLNNSLENFCESRKEQTATKCKSFVRTQLPKFYEIVKNITDHDTGFCMTMGYCNQTTNWEDFLKTLPRPNPLATDTIDLLGGDLLEEAEDLIPNENELLSDSMWANGKPNSSVCDGCKKVMSRINERILSRGDLKDKLLKILLQTCPKKDDACRKFYKKYINYFYDILVRNTEPNRACEMMRLCMDDATLNNEEEAEKWQPAIKIDDDSTVCKECESAVSYLVDTMNNKTVVDFVMKEIQIKVCNPLNFIERKACNRLVKQFGPKLMAKFVARISKDKICTHQLKLCKEEGHFWNIVDDDGIDFDLLNFVEDPKCKICQRSVSKLNELRGESSLKPSVEEICGDDAECSEFMFNFADFFHQDDTNTDALIACSELDVCMIPGRVQLLGATKCTYGPSYWCLSKAHADACKTTSFCEQTHWQAVQN